MKRALVVGINYYENVSNLKGCFNDAFSVRSILETNSDETKNFDVKASVSTSKENAIDRSKLKEYVSKLFKENAHIALFYFSGHGFIENTGGYLITSECKHGDAGFSMNELLQIANESPATSKIIILDCCHSGILGNPTPKENRATISEGLTILTASSKDQYAMETRGSGIFTSLLIDALNGGAADLLGHITPGSIYAYLDRSLGGWQQRPIFKANISNFTSLRKTQPPIALKDLRKIAELFPKKGIELKLDPSFEPESKNPNIANIEQFRILQKLNRANLVVPVGAEHMYFAAMESKSCKLTVLGAYYWDLTRNKRI